MAYRDQFWTKLAGRKQTSSEPKNLGSLEPSSKVERALLFCSLGNGLTVVDKLHEQYGDDEIIAHINKDREVTYFVNDLAQEYKKRIESVAKSMDPNVSQTQDDKVFTTRPARQEQKEEESEGFSPR